MNYNHAWGNCAEWGPWRGLHGRKTTRKNSVVPFVLPDDEDTGSDDEASVSQVPTGGKLDESQGRSRKIN